METKITKEKISKTIKQFKSFSQHNKISLFNKGIQLMKLVLTVLMLEKTQKNKIYKCLTKRR